MVYSAPMKLAIGAVRKSLTRFDATLNGWDERFRTHGEHQVNKDAPLILVACSGGRDSLALAAAARTVCTSWGLRCGAVIVDHSMQQGSAEVAARAAKQCADLGLEPVIVERIVLDPQTMRQRGSEAAARQMRYETITRVAGRTGAEAVLLAHTRNDQAETVLINLLTSGGLDGMAGMPERTQIADVALLRPLLDLTRADTTQICESLGLEFWDDPTNGEFLSARNACGETDTSDESSQHASSVSSDSSQPSAGHGTSHGTSHGTDCVTDYATAQGTSRPPFPPSSRTLDNCVTCGEEKREKQERTNQEKAQGRARSAVHLPLRSRIRQLLLPQLSRFTGGDMVSRLASFAAANRDDVDFLQEQAALVYEQAVSFGAQSVDNADGISDVATDSGTTLALIDRDVLLEAHPALRRRVLARVFAQLNIRASAVHVTAALNLIENQQSRGVQLPTGYVLKRYGHVIRLCHDNVHANRGYSGKHRS